MRKYLFIIIIIIAAAISFFIMRSKKYENTIVIGVVQPLEHKAMDEIVAGFSETLAQNYHKKYVIKVENAQNDNNLQRAIFQKMRDAHYDIIVPIGTVATQMAVAMIHDRPIVSLAAELSEEDRKKLNPCHVTVVHDEIPVEKIFQFIHEAYPHIKTLSLLHSSSDKVLPEIPKTIAIGKLYGIAIDHYMASTLPDLISVAQSLPTDTQGIFILKDSLIVSGIGTLAKIAAQKKIPLITSDEGSVEDGASFALGVHEKQIGVEGAILTAKVLEGHEACSLPIQEMTRLSIFVNSKSLKEQNLKESSIQKAAQLLNYQTEEK